jgi:hypothetical protein
VQAAAQHLHGGDRAAPCMHVRGGARPRLVWLYELVGQACSSLPRSSELLGHSAIYTRGSNATRLALTRCRLGSAGGVVRADIDVSLV